jgi:hypothetical protein
MLVSILSYSVKIDRGLVQKVANKLALGFNNFNWEINITDEK